MPSSLIADAAALVDNFSAGREQLRAFAEAHPVEAIYAELSSSSAAATIDAAAVAVVGRALAKVFADPELASGSLPETCPFAVAAVRSRESPEQLRALAAEALGRCVAAGVGGTETEDEASPASTLVAALGDRSAAVGAAAERGGRLAAATEVGARSLLRAGLVSKMCLEQHEMTEGAERGEATTAAALARARALSVAAAALAAGSGPAAALKEAGAFSAVSEQLSLESSSRDPLSAAAALATISDAVSSVLERGGGDTGGARAKAVGSLLAAEVGRPLARLLASSLSSGPSVIFAVRMQAMQTAAKLVAAAVAGGGGESGGGQGSGAPSHGEGNDGDDDSTDAAAVAAAPAAASPSSSTIPSPSSPVGGLAAALLASIERSLDEEAAVGRDGEIVDDDDQAATSSSEEEASLLALAELGSTSGGASLVAAASPDALSDAARIALGGRGGSACRLAALHALASVAGVERMKRERPRRGRSAEAAAPVSSSEGAAGVLLPGAGESVLASALHSGALTRAAGGSAASSSPASALLLLISRQPLLDEKVAALRLTLALCARPWGAAEVAMHRGLLERLVDVAADAASATAEWRHAACVALGETAARALSAAEGGSQTLGPTQLSALAAARPAVEAAVRSGPHGIGGPAPRFVATRAAN